MSLLEKIKHKYALSDQGARDMVKAIVAVTISDIVLMFPVGILYLLASDILKGTIGRDRISLYIGGTVATLLLIILTSYFQYNATFLSTYIESGVRRRTLAEKLRKLPLSFFGKKDLAHQHDYGRLCMAGNSKLPFYSGADRSHDLHNDRSDQSVLL